MFIDQAGLILIFKTLTFLALCGITSYVYRKHARPLLKQMLEDLQASYAYFAKTKYALDKQQLEIASHAKAQQDEAQQLAHKVALWQQQVQKRRDAYDALVRETQKRIAHERARQHQEGMLIRVYTSATLQAVQLAQHDLMKRYAQQSEGTTYLDDLVRHLKDQEVS
jgi:hypothetical protein